MRGNRRSSCENVPRPWSSNAERFRKNFPPWSSTGTIDALPLAGRGTSAAESSCWGALLCGWNSPPPRHVLAFSCLYVEAQELVRKKLLMPQPQLRGHRSAGAIPSPFWVRSTFEKSAPPPSDAFYEQSRPQTRSYCTGVVAFQRRMIAPRRLHQSDNRAQGSLGFLVLWTFA